MCGIAGWIDWNRSEPNGDSLRAMTRRLRHRGPDGEGYYEKEGAHLGHRRLSIIDLQTGAQPLCNEDESVWIVFNGEIFNFQELRENLLERGHQFKTQGDTEVIVHLYEEYGDRCVDHLRGQFAFALWDVNDRRLLLARDRLGQKPLYYYHRGDQLFFASELKSLMCHPAVPRDIDLGALNAYLTYHYVPDPISIVQGVCKLPPAHVMSVDASGAQLERYWSPDYASKETIDEREAIERLDALLEESVRLRMISDVPLGAFLSGGVDSSLVVAYMSRLSDRPIKTFTIGFDESSYDERRYARQVAERFGTEHHEFVVRSDAIESLDEILGYFDEPFADSSALPVYYLSQLTRQEVTVALNGDGADESFAGYRRYKGMMGFRHYRRLPSWLRAGALATAKICAATPIGQLQAVRRVRDWDALATATDGEIYQRCMATPNDQRRMLLSEELRFCDANENFLDIIAKEATRCPSSSLLDRVLFADQMTYLPGDLLVKADRMTMSHSLEARSPFLDHHVVDFAARLPERIKFRRGRQKHLLRRLLRRDFPRSFVDRRKQGFGVPLDKWFRDDLNEMMRESIEDSTLVEAGYLDRQAMRDVLAQHERGEANRQATLWGLLVLERWHREVISS